ncbi:MAG: hypothetical protein ABSB42_18995 [Tepidisphaeraceae bacterium]
MQDAFRRGLVRLEETARIGDLEPDKQLEFAEQITSAKDRAEISRTVRSHFVRGMHRPSKRATDIAIDLAKTLASTLNDTA